MIEYIPAALARIVISKDAIKLMLDAPKQLEKTEMQLNLASLNRTLFEAENALLESQRLLKEKDSEIATLKDLQKFQEKLVHKDGMCFETDENNNPIGNPYCSKCWDDEKKSIHLKIIQPTFFECPKCKNRFGHTKSKPTPKVVQGGRNFMKGWR